VAQRPGMSPASWSVRGLVPPIESTGRSAALRRTAACSKSHSVATTEIPTWAGSLACRQERHVPHERACAVRPGCRDRHLEQMARARSLGSRQPERQEQPLGRLGT
jgi:hypothetical protein